MIRIINARDIAQRDSQPTVKEWFRVSSIQMKMRGGLKTIFDGTTHGTPVHALLSNGRWMALCDQPRCMGCEMVDPWEKVFFCLTCGNGNTGKARPVIFPQDWKEIEDAMLERDMMPVGVGNDIVMAFNARPLHPDLRRDWVPEVMKDHPALPGRVIVPAYGESATQIRKRTEDIRNAISL